MNTEPIALLVHCMRAVSVHVCIYLNAVFLLQFGKMQELYLLVLVPWLLAIIYLTTPSQKEQNGASVMIQLSQISAHGPLPQLYHCVFLCSEL